MRAGVRWTARRASGSGTGRRLARAGKGHALDGRGRWNRRAEVGAYGQRRPVRHQGGRLRLAVGPRATGVASGGLLEVSRATTGRAVPGAEVARVAGEIWTVRPRRRHRDVHRDRQIGAVATRPDRPGGVVDGSDTAGAGSLPGEAARWVARWTSGVPAHGGDHRRLRRAQRMRPAASRPWPPDGSDRAGPCGETPGPTRRCTGGGTDRIRTAGRLGVLGRARQAGDAGREPAQRRGRLGRLPAERLRLCGSLERLAPDRPDAGRRCRGEASGPVRRCGGRVLGHRRPAASAPASAVGVGPVRWSARRSGGPAAESAAASEGRPVRWRPAHGLARGPGGSGPVRATTGSSTVNGGGITEVRGRALRHDRQLPLQARHRG